MIISDLRITIREKGGEMKYTAEEVRAISKRLHDDITVADGDALMASDMLTELAERIKVDESAAPVGFVMEATATRHKFGLLTQDLPPGAELFTHPPAQAAQSVDVERLLAVLGHIRVPNTRCLARVAETPPELRPPGPHNPPMWCCLPQGHDGPHRHNGGGMYPSIPFRDTDEVVMGDPLPDRCEKCHATWPCADVQAITAALSAQPAQSVDVAVAIRKGFMTAESCGPDKRYVLSIKFGSLDDLQAAHNALVGLTAALQDKTP